jgi:hypothetical protein
MMMGFKFGNRVLIDMTRHGAGPKLPGTVVLRADFFHATAEDSVPVVPDSKELHEHYPAAWRADPVTVQSAEILGIANVRFVNNRYWANVWEIPAGQLELVPSS